MSNVIMMCGVCGSGKTTFAMEKEKEGYVRLSIDEELWQTCGQYGVDYQQEAYEELSLAAEERLCRRMTELIRAGKNVVLDFSFWNRDTRERYRKLIAEAGATYQLVYMKADKEVLRKRLAIRNQAIHANSSFAITDEILEHHYNSFQEPLEDETPLLLVQSE